MSAPDPNIEEILDTPERRADATAAHPPTDKAEEGSLLGDLRQARRAVSEERHFDLDIPGTNGALVARYRPLEWDEADEITTRVQKSNSKRANLYGALDVLVRACVEIFIRRPGGELVPFREAEESFGDEPVRFDSRLATGLQLEATTAREIVRELVDNDLAIMDHQSRVSTWMLQADAEDERDF